MLCQPFCPLCAEGGCTWLQNMTIIGDHCHLTFGASLQTQNPPNSLKYSKKRLYIIIATDSLWFFISLQKSSLHVASCSNMMQYVAVE